MKALQAIVICVSLLALPALTETKARTVILSVPDMNCPACPITLQKALHREPGVKAVEVRYRQRELMVTFDSEQTSVAALLETTANVGFPATVKSGDDY